MEQCERVHEGKGRVHEAGDIQFVCEHGEDGAGADVRQECSGRFGHEDGRSCDRCRTLFVAHVKEQEEP